MGEGTWQLPPDSTGKLARTQTNAGVASGAHQQVASIAGSEGIVAQAATDPPALTDAGLITRPIAEDWTATGTLTASGNTVTLPLGAGAGLASFDLRGTWPAGTLVNIEGTVDGTNWETVYLRSLSNDQNIVSASGLNNTAPPLIRWANVGGYASVRVRCTATGGATSIAVVIRALGIARNPLFGASVSTGDANAFEPGLHVRPLPLALTKGSQQGNGYTVQQLHNAGRTHHTYYIEETVATTAALRTSSRSVGGATATTASSWTVTSGKFLRITSMTIAMHHTAVNFYKAWLRWSSTGAVTNTSPIIAVLVVQNQATQGGDSADIVFPEGFELSGTQQLGISTVGGVAAGSGIVTVQGYEY